MKVIRTKISIPSLCADHLPRERCQILLQQAIRFPVCLVSAAVGYGKTSLLSEFAHHHPECTAWINLETTENDPVRFFRYFEAALKSLFPGFEMSFPLAIPEIGMSLITSWIDDCCNMLLEINKSIVMVIDNFQTIHHQEIIEALSYFIEHQPANIHIILSTRTTPAMPINRCRARGILAEITARDLAFTFEEAVPLLIQENKSQIDQNQLLKLFSLTEGWPAGLRLLAYVQREQADMSFVWKKGKKLAVDYLTEEVLDNLPTGWLDYLKKLSIFDQFDERMAQHISKNPQSNKLLTQIQASNLFLSKQGNAWIFHPIFRESLQQRCNPEENAILHQQAAIWFQSNQEIEKAIFHAISGEHWHMAIQMIMNKAEELFQQGELYTLQSWIEIIPKTQKKQFPDLLILSAWVCYLQGKNLEAQQIIDSIDAAGTLSSIQLQEWWAGLRCQFALLRENNQEALTYAQNALMQSQDNGKFIRGMLLSSQATAFQALGKSDEAVKSFQEANRIYHDVDNVFTSIFSLTGLCMELNEQGQRLRAIALCEQSLEDNYPLRRNNPMIGPLYLLQSRLYWEANQLTEAKISLETAEVLLGKLGLEGFLISADIIRAQIFIASEEYGNALQLVRKNLKKTHSEEFKGFHQHFDLLKADILFKMGNNKAIETWLAVADLPDHPQDDPAREMEFILKAKYLVEKGVYQEADQILEELFECSKKNHHVRVQIAAHLIKAVMMWNKGEIGWVNHCLEEVFELAIPQQYYRLLLEYGVPVAGILVQLPAATDEIRRLFGFTKPSETFEIVEMLTRRELEVLRLLAENRTNTEIAEVLFVSNETVKVHLKHIFQKFGVKNRRQAVRQARQLNLI